MQECPIRMEREKVKAKLNKTALAHAVAQLVKQMLPSIQTQELDYWVHLDLDVHIKNGKAQEKLAKINLYTEMADPYGTNILDVPAENELPTEFFKAFCDRC